MDFIPQFTPCQPVYAIIPPLAPSIESSRLVLRPLTEDDIPAVFAIRSRPEVAKFNDPREPFQSLQQTQEWFRGKAFLNGPAEAIGRSFIFAIVDKSIPQTQELVIGYVSINALEPSPEIGYSLLPEAWGKGYATEALQMMLKIWWDLPRRTLDGDEHQEESIYAICDRQNLGSCNVLKKCGFEIVLEDVYRDFKLFVFGLGRPASDQRGEGVPEYRYIES